MNFKRYINERDEDEEFVRSRLMELGTPIGKIDKFFKDTSFYWSKFPKYVFYRGMEGRGYFGTKDVRQDRKPKDTPMYLHDIINKYMYKKFRMDRSDSLFVTGSKSMARIYSKGHYKSIFEIYPIGNFNWLWSSDIEDMFETLGGHKTLWILKNSDNEEIAKKSLEHSKKFQGHLIDMTIDDVYKILYELLDTYKKNFPIASNFNGEILINCKEYYYLERGI